MATQIKLRRDTAANWTSINPILALGEPGIEIDTRKIKYGDGTTAWTSLAYSAGDANFSGNYTDLSNKPTIPDAQIQSDWTQATNTALDFIKNKPTLVTNLDSLSDVTITTASSGQVLKFNGTAWVNDTDSTGGGSSTGNITFSDTTMTSTNGDVKIGFSPTASPAVEFTFTDNGNLVLPQGTILSETANSTTITPPNALAGQGLVVRLTVAQGIVSDHPGGFADGDTITLTVTPDVATAPVTGTVDYTFTGCTSVELGRALTGTLTFTAESAKPISWTIPVSSTMTTFTITLSNASGFDISGISPLTLTKTGSSEDHHIHLIASDPSITDIYLGDDDQYVKIEKNGGNVVIGTDTNSRQWTFGTNGNLTLPDTTSVLANVSITLEANDTGNITGLSVIGDYHANLYAHGNVKIVSDSSNTTATWAFGTDGNLTLPSNTSKINYANGTSILSGLGGGGGGIALTDISVGADNSASGGGGLSYANSTGVFTYTPPDLSGYVTGTPWTSEGYLTTITNIFDQDLNTSNNVTFNSVITSNVHATNGAPAIGSPIAVGGAGSLLTISAGDGGIATTGVNAGNGGNLTITAGDAGSDIGNPSWGNIGGTLVLRGGNSSRPYHGSDVQIHSGDSLTSPGLISLHTGTNQWTFGKTGDLTLANSATIIAPADNDLTLVVTVEYNICTLLTGGSGYGGGGSSSAISGGSGTGMMVSYGYGLSGQVVNVSVTNPGTGYVDGDVLTMTAGSGATFEITRYNSAANPNTNTAPADWTFGTDGTTTFPTNISINYSGNNAQFPRIIADSGKAFSIQAQGSTGSTALSWTVDPDAAGQYAQIGVTKNGGDNLAKVILTAQSDSSDAGTAKTWKFDETGNLTLPASGDIVIPNGRANVTGTANTVGGGATVGVRSILAIDSAFGSNDANDPASAQAIRGRVTGSNLTKTRNYVAGVTGQYLVTGTNASEFINTGLLGVVGDQTTTANAAVVAYLDGDGGLTTAGSAYGVSMKNSTPGSGFDYGLDLQFINLNVAGTTTPFKQADIRFNNGALQRNTGLVPCAGGASTIVYVASADIQHTIKLLIQVEGLVGAETLPDTQSCEMIIAKSFRGNNVSSTVYAVVHTSVAPLATFTALWDGIINRVEVICTPTGANAVDVKTFATEITAVVT